RRDGVRTFLESALSAKLDARREVVSRVGHVLEEWPAFVHSRPRVIELCGTRVARYGDRNNLRVRRERSCQGDRFTRTRAWQRLCDPGQRPPPNFQPPGWYSRPGHAAHLFAAVVAHGNLFHH